MELRIKNIKNAPELEKCIEMVCSDYGCAEYVLDRILKQDGKIHHKYHHGCIDIEFEIIFDRRLKENQY